MENLNEKAQTYNYWLLAAAIVMFSTCLIHVFVGGPEIYTPLRASSLVVEVKSVLSVVWHSISLFLLMFAAALFWLSKTYDKPLALLVGFAQLGFALLFMGYGYADTGNLTVMPQWTIFLVGALLMWFGHRKEV